MNNPSRDIMGHLLEHTEDTAAGRALLSADSRIIIGAGRVSLIDPRSPVSNGSISHSDTTSSTLTVLFVLLATYPKYQQRLRHKSEILLKVSTYNSETERRKPC